MPKEIGLKIPQMYDAALAGKLKALWLMGEDLAQTDPNSNHVIAALQKIDLLIVQEIFMTETATLAHVVLPATTFLEKSGTSTNGERRIQRCNQVVQPLDGTKTDGQIMVDIMNRRGYPQKGPDPAVILEEIARVVPFYDGIQHLQKGGDQFQYGGPHLCADGRFPTEDGKAHFRAVALPGSSPTTGPALVGGTRGSTNGGASNSFIVSTRRGKQFNTLIYAEIDPLNGAARDSVLMNPDDAAALHLRSNDRVALVSDAGRYEGRVFLAPIARGNLQIHWPEGNVVIPRGLHDTLGGVPDYNANVILEKLPS
jgi:predicted molibdopterin-dependent oxidoreductase YjgC